jgi:hypothetical protein
MTLWVIGGFLYYAGINKHYDIIDLFHDRVPSYDIYCHPGGYIDRGLKSKIIERAKSYQLS